MRLSDTSIDRPRFYGVYRGRVTKINDPLKQYRIKAIVPQALGEVETNWAEACSPVTSRSGHPDHQQHTPAQVADMIATHVAHTATITSEGASTGNYHTHDVVINLSHAAHSAKTGASDLSHPHVSTSETVYDQIEGGHSEHTLHRRVPAVGQDVWIMFEGGDPDFPVWMGVSY